MFFIYKTEAHTLTGEGKVSHFASDKRQKTIKCIAHTLGIANTTIGNVLKKKNHKCTEQHTQSSQGKRQQLVTEAM